jgi:hypothetical protein
MERIGKSDFVYYSKENNSEDNVYSFSKVKKRT